MTTFARAFPVSLSGKPLSPGIEATPKTTYLFHARSFIAKHGVLLVNIVADSVINLCIVGITGEGFLVTCSMLMGGGAFRKQ